MTDDSLPRRLSPGRRVLGIAAAAFTLGVAVLFVLGAWNPWAYVLLRRHFGNPLLGLVVTLALASVVLWLLAPVRNEAEQHGRVYLRFGVVAVLVVAASCWGLLRTPFQYESTVLAHSASGERQVALVTTRGEDRELRLWAGTGLGVRDLGSLGLACGSVTARFDGEDRVHVESAYGTFDLRVDPRTGVPRDRIWPTCSG